MTNPDLMPVIHYLGPTGTFSEQAAQMLGGDLLAILPERAGGCSFVPQPMISRALTAIDGADTFAAVPYYNLLEGLIQETLDLIVEHDLEVFAARQIPIRHALGGFLPDTPNTVVPVFSHPKALHQCSVFLEENYPTATYHETSSTSQAVHHVADKRFGLAIARRETLEKLSVPVLHDDIGNRQYSRQNTTEFLLVGRKSAVGNISDREQKQQPNSHMRTLIAMMPAIDRVGLLADILGQIAFFGINLLKIHSRPALTDAYGPAPQMFYIETDVATDSPELRLCIETFDMWLAKRGNNDDLPRHETGPKVVRVLGTYGLYLP